MEKTFFKRLYIGGGGAWSPSRYLNIMPLTLRITDQRIKVTQMAIPIFEEMLSAISYIKVTPELLGAEVEIKLKALNRSEFSFTIGEIGNLVGILKQLNIKVEYDDMALQKEERREKRASSSIVVAISIILGAAFIVFIIYHILLSVR